MVEKIPQTSGKELVKMLYRLGFYFKSRKGSHIKLAKTQESGEIVIIVPDHKIIRKGTLHGILKHLNLDIKEFKKLH